MRQCLQNAPYSGSGISGIVQTSVCSENKKVFHFRDGQSVVGVDASKNPYR